MIYIQYWDAREVTPIAGREENSKSKSIKNAIKSNFNIDKYSKVLNDHVEK